MVQVMLQAHCMGLPQILWTSSADADEGQSVIAHLAPSGCRRCQLSLSPSPTRTPLKYHWIYFTWQTADLESSFMLQLAADISCIRKSTGTHEDSLCMTSVIPLSFHVCMQCPLLQGSPCGSTAWRL